MKYITQNLPLLIAAAIAAAALVRLVIVSIRRQQEIDFLQNLILLEDAPYNFLQDVYKKFKKLSKKKKEDHILYLQVSLEEAFFIGFCRKTVNHLYRMHETLADTNGESSEVSGSVKIALRSAIMKYAFLSEENVKEVAKVYSFAIEPVKTLLYEAMTQSALKNKRTDAGDATYKDLFLQSAEPKATAA